MNKFKSNKHSEDFVFDDSKSKYENKKKKRNYLWLWLLIAAIFIALCFVKCERDITVKVEDGISQDPVTLTTVTVDYTAHYLFNEGTFFDSKPYSSTLETDENGEVVFEDLPCSVFSYIFYAFSEADFTVEGDCYNLNDSPAKRNFHYTWSTSLKLEPKTTDFPVTVIDRETDEPLAGAIIRYKYNIYGEIMVDSVITNAAGKSVISNMPQCGIVSLECVSCYGYEDTTHIKLSVIDDVLPDPSSTIVPLTPIKQSFTYFVKNKYTRQPIPAATVEVVLTSGNGNVTRGQSTTNVDGQGRGAFNDAFILANVFLNASKTHYKPGQFDRRCTVKEFAELPDSSRVIYLEPEPYMDEFQNVDSITGRPIAGVQNTIVVYGQNGQTVNSSEISNRNGIFYVKAMEGDKVVIDSECNPQYRPKHTEIESFENGKIIPMLPNRFDLEFRTLVAGTQNLLPNCSLRIFDADGNSYRPNDSGNGSFTVERLPVNAIISIIADKEGYEPNSTSVERVAVSYLMSAPQSKRDIPLGPEMLPCNAGVEIDHALAGDSHQRTFGLGRQSGTTTITLDFDAAEDWITVYDGPNTSSPVIIPKTAFTYRNTIPIRFNHGCITVVMEGTTIWKYTVNCPN